MSYCKQINENTIRVGEVRFSYVHVFTPKEPPSGGEPKYSVSLLIDKDDAKSLKLINAAIDSAIARGKAETWGGKLPSNLRRPLRDGDNDRPDDDSYAGCYFINASATKAHKPGVKVLEDGQIVDALDEDDFYSGCYGAAVLQFYTYDKAGNRGVGAALMHVIKTRDGEKLSGGISADAALGDLTD